MGELTNGVPDMVPVELLMLSPDGSAGEIEKLVGVLPVIAETVLSGIVAFTQVLMEVLV